MVSPYVNQLLMFNFPTNVHSYTSFKGIVHPGNSKNKRLLLDPCHLIFRSIVPALFVPCVFRKVYLKASI